VAFPQTTLPNERNRSCKVKGDESNRIPSNVRAMEGGERRVEESTIGSWRSCAEVATWVKGHAGEESPRPHEERRAHSHMRRG